MRPVLDTRLPSVTFETFINSAFANWRVIVAVSTGSLYVWRNASDHPLAARSAQVAISAGVGVSNFESVALKTGAPEELVAIILTVLGYVALDIITKIGRDPDFWKGIIQKRMEK